MKNGLLYLLSLILLASCSAPKYTYYFDHYNYNAGKKKSPQSVNASVLQGTETIKSEELIASTETRVAPLKEETQVTAQPKEVRKTYVQMTKNERKDLRNRLKAEIKNYTKEKKSIKDSQATKLMDRDLKLAAIFGAVGLVGLIIGGDFFYIIGGIALLIGVVFFVKWLIRQ